MNETRQAHSPRRALRVGRTAVGDQRLTMKTLFAVPAWALIYTVMACYMQDSRARAQPYEEVELVQWRGGWNRGGWHQGGGWNRGNDVGGAIIGGLIGGVIGGVFQPRPYYPQQQPYFQQPVDPYVYCSQRFRSWNPETGFYLGFDGAYHRCP